MHGKKLILKVTRPIVKLLNWFHSWYVPMGGKRRRMDLSLYDVEMLKLILEHTSERLLIPENQELTDWIQDFRERLDTGV